MLYDVENSCYQLLKLLGCDLSAIDTITTWKQFGVLCIEFIFACIMLYLLWKMLYNAMIRFSTLGGGSMLTAFILGFGIPWLIFFLFWKGDDD